jgi:hypothetical protein
MEIVQTSTSTWPWCMGMFGARFAVFVRQVRVLPSPCPATRNLSFLRVHLHRRPVVSTRCFNGMVRVGVKIPQDGNRANRYRHVAVARGHVWRTVCGVCAKGFNQPPFPRNSPNFCTSGFLFQHMAAETAPKVKQCKMDKRYLLFFFHPP